MNPTNEQTNELKENIALLTCSDPAPALSALVALAKKREPREELKKNASARETIAALLTADDPKARKNAARLIGALGDEADAERLSEQLSAERTRFVVPSILLALGSVGGETARQAVEGYPVPEPQDETEVKHCAEIAAAKRKAQNALQSDEPLPAYRTDGEQDYLLTAPVGFTAELGKELKQKGFTFRRSAGGAVVRTAEPQKLKAVRTAAEVLLPVGMRVPYDPDALKRYVTLPDAVPYRIELRVDDETESVDRRREIARLAAALGGTNNPSHYAVEVRVTKRGRFMDVSLVPMLKDGRFAYRRQALPASIAPATAAALAAFAYEKHAELFPETTIRTVLDPFCGSGTLLIETERYCRMNKLPVPKLVGVDIAPNAITAARGNADAAKTDVKLIQRDILRFDVRERADLILTNMPFGNRVGTHASNETLYRGFVEKLTELLSDTGAAVLYTMEYRLLKKCISARRELTLSGMNRTEAGGLLPWVFVVRKTDEA